MEIKGNLRINHKLYIFVKNWQKVTDFQFIYGELKLKIVFEYKYVGLILDEHLTFNSFYKILADSGGSAPSSVRSGIYR